MPCSAAQKKDKNSALCCPVSCSPRSLSPHDLYLLLIACLLLKHERCGLSTLVPSRVPTPPCRALADPVGHPTSQADVASGLSVPWGWAGALAPRSQPRSRGRPPPLSSSSLCRLALAMWTSRRSYFRCLTVSRRILLSCLFQKPDHSGANAF